MELSELLNLNKFSGYSNYFPGLGNTHIKGIPIASSVTLPTLNIPEQLPYKNVRKPSGNFNWSGVGNAIGATAAFAGDVYNGTRYENSAQDLLQNSGRSNGSVNGVGYEMQNSIDADREMQIEHRQNVSNTLKSMGSGAAMGAAVGSILPGVGTVIGGAIGSVLGLAGGLFGSGKRHAAARKAIAEANNQRMRTNNYNRDVAMTTGMQADFANEYGNTEDQVLYAEHGKNAGVNPTKKSMKLELTQTPFGIIKGIPNMITHNGESLWQPGKTPLDGTGAVTKTGTGNKENAPTLGNRETVAFGDKESPNGISYEDLARGPVQALENMDRIINSIKSEKSREIAKRASAAERIGINNYLFALSKSQEATPTHSDYTNLPEAKHGKDCLPKFKIGGWLGNAIPGTLGMLTGIGQYFDARNQDVYRPNTYVENPYEHRALTGLQELRVNPYNMMQQLRSIAGRANYAVDTAGALSGAQKMLQKTAIAANTQANTANALQNIAEKNIALRANAYNAMLNAGAQSAQNRMKSTMYDTDVYMKSHAARQSGMQMGIYNFINALNQYTANEYKRRMGNAMIDLYSDDLRSRRV